LREAVCFLADLSRSNSLDQWLFWDQWPEIHPEHSFAAQNDSQSLVLELEPPFSYDFYREGKAPNAGKGILMPDKEVINPEIQIVDEQGNSFDLVYSGARRSFCPAYSL
jgi:hypothetical protein